MGAVFVPARPDGAETLVRHEALEQFHVHAGELLGEVSVRHVRQAVGAGVVRRHAHARRQARAAARPAVALRTE